MDEERLQVVRPVGYDETAKVWLKPLSLLLNCMFPVEYVYSDWYLWTGLVEAAMMEPRSIASYDEDDIMCGSRIEGLSIPHFFLARTDEEHWQDNPMAWENREIWKPDIDGMHVTSHLFKSEDERWIPRFTAEHDKDDPRYVKLKPSEEWRKEYTQYKNVPFINHAFLFTLPRISSNKNGDVVHSLSYAVHGPARKLLHSGSHGFRYEEDVVNVFTYPEAWPERAMEWLVRTRHHSWPSAELIQDIFESGCHVAPVGRGVRHRDPILSVDYARDPGISEAGSGATGATSQQMDETEWRMSFSVAENKLAASLSPVQRHLLVLLKMLKKLYLDDTISSYILKNLLFWECESRDPEFWNDNNFGNALLMILDRLSTSLRERRLPHYIMPDSNLLQNEDRKVLDKGAALVDGIRKHVLSKVVSMLLRLQSLNYASHIYLTDTTLVGEFSRKIQDQHLSESDRIELEVGICEEFAGKSIAILKEIAKVNDCNPDSPMQVPFFAYQSILSRILCWKWSAKNEELERLEEEQFLEFLQKETGNVLTKIIKKTSLEYLARAKKGQCISMIIPSVGAMTLVRDSQRRIAHGIFERSSAEVKQKYGLIKPVDWVGIKDRLKDMLQKDMENTLTYEDLVEEAHKVLENLQAEREANG